MSGGHYDYKYHALNELSDAIEQDFLKDGKYMTDDYSVPHIGFSRHPQVGADRIGDATEEERPLILAEIKSLIADLKKCAFRAREIEWYMSGDTGATSYLKRLSDDK